MTPANPDALVEALVDQIARILDLDAHHLGRPDYYGPERILAFASARVRVARQKASAIIAGPLAPLLADLQQQAASISSLEESVNSLEADLQRVTAERDEWHSTLRYCEGEWSEERGVMLDKLQAERVRAAQLQAEVAEAQDIAKQLQGSALDAEHWQGEAAQLQAEVEALRADRDDAIRMLDVWFDTSTKTNEQVVPQLVDALVGYLRTCRCGGMPAETSDMIEAGAADFIRRRAGYIIAPVIETMVADRTAALRAEVEAKDRALKDERARRKAAIQSVREKAAALCDEAAAYFDRTTGHYDRAQAAGGYRATAAKVRLLTPDRTALAARAATEEGSKPWPREPQPFSERGFDTLWIDEWRAKNGGSLGDGKKAHNEAIRAARAATAREGA